MNRVIKSICALWFAAAMLSLACAEQAPITIELTMDAPGISSVYYTAYLAGDAACSGGGADLDGQELEPGRVLAFQIQPWLLGDDADLTAFSIDFSPFDGESPVEMGRTAPVAFPVEYGGVYRLRLTQDENGYAVVLADKFTIEISGDVLPGEVDFSYIHVDYFVGDVQCGFLYTCADVGDNAIRLEFTPESFDGIIEDADITSFRADVYLSYADQKGDAAVLAAMMGDPGQDVYLTTISIPAEYGCAYRYALTAQPDGSYTLEEIENSLP